MADDIDIEEHDVLETLRRRHLDAVVKTEPLDAEDIDPQYEEDASNHFQSQWEWESHSTDTPRIKVETPEMEAEFQFGKIILGSKPAQVDQTHDNAAQENHVNYNYNMSLVLEDWGPILRKSNCYCPDCEILFATVNALDAHKMMAHSFLVATDKEASPDKNKAIKSTARPSDDKPTCEICNHQFQGIRAAYNLMKHYRNIHRVHPSDKETMEKLKTWKICNHCNVYFPSDTDLVKHLYELLPLNDKTPTKDDKNKRTPIKVQSAVKPDVIDNIKNSSVRTHDKKPVLPVKSAAIPSSHDFKSVKVKNATIVKDVKTVLSPTVTKQSNSIILGSKVNTTLDVKMETSTVKSNTEMKCEVCGIEYSRKYYTKHMKKFHLDFFASKLARLKKMQPPPNSDRYKCKLCNKILVGKLVAKNHRQTKHPEMGSRKILIRMVNKLKKTQPRVVPKTEAPAEEKHGIVVSKSTLFKCNKCSSHFLTCYGACAHSRVCESSSNLRDWMCPECQRVFKNTDKKAHQFQHKANSAKFKVYVVYLEMVVRILCECPFCYVCFEEYKFWRHINFGCDKDAESFYCNECKLPIDATSRASHESKHTQGDFTQEDFIKVDFVATKKKLGEVKLKSGTRIEIPTPTLKRKLPPSEIEPKKKRRKKGGDLHLYYCTTCKCYVTTKVSYHTEGRCIELMNNRKGKKVIRPSCKICAISFTNKSLSSHRAMHMKYPNLTLSNLVFTRISDGKKMRPSPEYYPCKNCLVNFVTASTRYYHSCDSVKSFTCQVCQRKIEKEAQKAHMRFHTYGAAATKPPSSKTQQNAKPAKQNFKLVKANSTEKLPELLMKYQSLTTLWNILYLCVTCDTFTDSYDKVVEHSQNHHTNMENYGVVIMKCQLCNMKFDSECYRRHLELHAGSRDISKKSFKILKYDHTKLFSKDWLSFIDLPEDRKSQILSRSIYGEMRSIRMRLVQQGPPEYTVYRCARCNKCVSKHTLPHHINLQHCVKANKIFCSYCNMSFATRQPCEEHEEVHQNKNLGEDSFRIVEFNSVDDAEFYKKVIPEHSSSTVAPEGDTSESGRAVVFNDDNVKEIKGQKFYMFYKCARCGVNTHKKKYSLSHICTSYIKKTCTRCGLVFGRNLHYHNKLHDKYDFSEKNVFTKTFNNSINNKRNDDEGSTSEEVDVENIDDTTRKDEARLYKCHCGLHYTSLKTIEKHYQMKNCSEVVREKCSQCNLIFDPIEVVNHLCKHHAQNRVSSFDIVTPTKKTLYKCNQCHVLFYDKIMAIGHESKCDGSGVVKCERCRLAFHESSIDAHREDHRTSGRLKPDCYIVTNVAERPQPNSTLYKCKQCNIHFMALKTLKNHIVKFNHKRSQIEKCGKCGLLFPHISLVKHQRYHHGVLKLGDFQFEYYETGDRKPTPKKNETRVEIEDTPVEEDNLVLKCKKCDMNFTDEDTLASHGNDRCSKELSSWCDVCNAKFASRNFEEHSKIHPIQKEQVPLFTFNFKETDKTLIKCRHCNLHFNLKKTFDLHAIRGCAVKAPFVRCDKCDILFTSHSSNRHSSLHQSLKLKKEDFTIITLPSLDDGKSRDAPTVADEVQSQASNNETAASLDSSFELETSDTKIAKTDKVKIKLVSNNETAASLDSSFELETSDTKIAKTDKVKIKLYKCGECNVYFLTQRTCYKHAVKHKSLDLKDFIECKLCGYQFTIMALQTHIRKHHATDFKLDEVLVEEYQPSILENNVPKIEIYYAIEKDQSRLVSTTTDVRNISMDTVTPGAADDNGSSEVTSNCNELTDDADAKQNFSEIEYLEDDLDIDDAMETND